MQCHRRSAASTVDPGGSPDDQCDRDRQTDPQRDRREVMRVEEAARLAQRAQAVGPWGWGDYIEAMMTSAVTPTASNT